MTRIQLACYCLLGSAFVLAGLLLTRLDLNFGNQAQAEMVIARENFTIMTAASRDGEESLYVLDNTTGRLMIYTLNVPRKQFVLAANEDIGRVFARAAGEAGGRGR